MDYKKHKKIIELLSNSSDISLNNLEEKIKLDKVELLLLLNNLKQMGVDVNIEIESVKLKTPVDLVDISFLEARLKIAQIDKPIKYFLATTSTNEIAKTCQEPTIYLAEYQNTGHGRHARMWLSPFGQGIILSITHDFNFGLHYLSGLNIAIGVAFIKAVKKCGYEHLKLKWPNDIIGKDGKVAGILIEISGNTKKSHVTIGVGANWKVKKEFLDKVTQDCMNMGIENINRTEFISILIIEIEEILNEFCKNKLENIRLMWNKYDTFKDKKISIIKNKKTWQAKYIGIDNQGCLQVKAADGIKTLVSAEVSIRKVD